MAKPLQFQPRPPSPQEQLDADVIASAPALEESLHLLRELHQHGVLELLIKLTKGGEGLSLGVLEVLGSEGGVRMLRSLIELLKGFEQLDPQDLRLFSQSLGAGLDEGAKAVVQVKGVGLSELFALIRDRDVQLALGAIFGLLKGMGKGLREAREET